MTYESAPFWLDPPLKDINILRFEISPSLHFYTALYTLATLYFFIISLSTCLSTALSLPPYSVYIILINILKCYILFWHLVEARNRTLTLHHCLPTSELPAREVRKCWEDNYQSLYQRNSDRQLVYTLFCLYHVLLGIEPSLTWKSTPTSVLPAGEVMGVSGGQLTTFTIWILYKI